MNSWELFGLRAAKLATSVSHPLCWRALAQGVAPTIEHVPVLRRLTVDGILDVGANRGQFTLACAMALPSVPVVAFEPMPHDAQLFRKIHGHRPSCVLVECALGASEARAPLHLSARADSSSLLPIGRLQAELFAGTDEVGTIEVQVRRLDDLRAYWQGRTRQLLKIDVQGYELGVLRGAVETLLDCEYVYAECSEVPLYEGQALRSEVEAFLAQQGFAAPERCNEQRHDGKLIQADYLFRRRT